MMTTNWRDGGKLPSHTKKGPGRKHSQGEQKFNHATPERSFLHPEVFDARRKALIAADDARFLPIEVIEVMSSPMEMRP